MDMKGGGMKEGAQQMPGLQSKQLGLKELSELAPKIRERLRFNALDTEQNRAATSERKSALSEIKHDLLGAAEHTVTFAAMKDGEVVGFLAVQKTPAGSKANIEQLWTNVPGHDQRPIVGTLLNIAKQYLTDHGYPHLKAEAISASADFSIVTANPEIGRFMRITHPEYAEPLDISIAPEELPLVSDSPSIAAEAPADASQSEEPNTHLENAM